MSEIVTMRATDSGGIHRSHGPNSWLTKGYDHVCRTVARQRRFVLKYTECTTADEDHIWLCDPADGSSVIALLPHALNQPLSKKDFVEIRIELIKRWPAASPGGKQRG
jgi:hypothetical protein